MKKTSIFIVENKDVISTSFTEGFSNEGCKIVGVAKTGKEAVKKIVALKPQIVLMDILMNQEYSYPEIVKEILRRYEVPIIYISSRIQGINIDELMVEGIYGIVSKSISSEELKLNIEIAINRFQLDQENKYDSYFLKEAQKISSVGHWKLDYIKNELLWADETYRIFGEDRSSFNPTYENFLEKVHPNDVDLVKEEFESSLENYDEYEVVHRIYADGKIKYVQEKGKHFFNNVGEPLVTLGTVQDITSKKEFEKTLIKQKNELKNLFDNSIDETFIFDPNCLLILDVNEKVLENLEYTRSEILRLGIDDISRPEDGVDEKEIRKKFIELEFGQELLLRGYQIRKSKSEYPVEVRVKKLVWDDAPAMIAVVRDVTAELQVEVERIQQFQMRDIINEILSLSIHSVDLDEFIAKALNIIVGLPFLGDLEKGIVFLKNEDRNLEMKASTNVGKDIKTNCSLVESGNCICGEVLRTGKSQLVCCEPEKFELESQKHKNETNYNVPIIHDGEVLGSLCLYSNIQSNKNYKNIDLLETIGRSLGLILVRYLDNKKLQKSEAKYRTYIENSTDVLTILDSSFCAQYVSPNITSNFGYEPSEYISESIFSFIYDEDLDLLKEKLIAAIDMPLKTLISEYRFKHASGKILWVESSLKFINNDGAPYFLINSREITVRKEIEQDLKVSEQRFRSLYNDNISGLYRIDLNSKILECNDSFAKILGFSSKKEIIEKKTDELYSSDTDIVEALKENKGELQSRETYLQLKRTNREIRLLQNAKFIYDSSNRPKYFEGSIIDTTSLLEAEKEKKLIEVLPAENPNPVLRVNYDLEVLYKNEPAAKLPDRLIEQNRIRSKRLIKFLNSFIRGRKNKSSVELKAGGQYYIFYTVHIREQKYVNLYGTDITALEESKAAHLQLSLELEKLVASRTEALESTVKELNKEIQQRTDTEKKLQTSLSEKEVLLNEITHRVKNNLQVISSLLSLQKGNIKNNESIELLTDTGHRIKSMALIHETLYKSSDFSQINFKSYTDSLIRYVMNSFDLDKVRIKSLVQDIHLTIDTASSCGMIIMELITNSMKYAFKEQDEGEIIIEVKELQESWFYLKIADNGVGLENNFDYKNTETLGMQLVHGLTNQLAGDVKITSDSGLTVEVNFQDTKRHKYE